jgi:E3 ubiquitin-protein ligase UBR7
LYACLTCINERKKSSPQPGKNQENDAYFLHGICLACSYECHENHELLELYTKRHFRCDCGNSKFPVSFKCKLESNKSEQNELNKYNHNFIGLYCACNWPYPDADTSAANSSLDDDEMLQCAICEDWFHLSHLSKPSGLESCTIDADDYDEMICMTCMNKNSFLWNYQGYILGKSNLKEEHQKSEQHVEVETANCDSDERLTSNHCCFLEKLKRINKELELNRFENKACFFLEDWRKALCKCSECMKVYKQNQVDFLLDEKDPINYYEQKGKEIESTQQQIDENKLLNDHLSKIPNRVAQIELIHNLNDFKQELKDFFAGFVAKGEVVKRENVTEFFESLNEKKRRRLDESNKYLLDYYCK